MARSYLVCIVIFLIVTAVPLNSAFAQCPPNAQVVGTTKEGNVETTRCRCNTGYQNIAGQCMPVGSGLATNIRGQVTVVTPEGRTVTVASGGAIELRDGTIFRTGSDGTMTLNLPAGSKIVLYPNTHFVVKGFASSNDISKQLVDLVNGLIRLNTSPSLRPRVNMPHVAVAVRGTDFECSLDPKGESYVKVYSGTVDVSSLGKTVAVDAGQIVRFKESDISAPTAFR